MPKFTVNVSREIYESGYFEVEAENKDAAAAKLGEAVIIWHGNAQSFGCAVEIVDVDEELTPEEIAQEHQSQAEDQAAADRDNEPPYIHVDAGAAGRELCPIHGKEVDAFGCCFACDSGN